MFELEIGQKPVDWNAARVVDHKRNVWLRRLTGRGPEAGDVFHLHWEGRDIPLTTWQDNQKTADGKNHTQTGFLEFGGSRRSRIAEGIPAYQFSSEKEKDAAKLLAAEALLVYGIVYDGLSRPNGEITVHIKDGANKGEYTLASFAYVPTMKPRWESE